MEGKASLALSLMLAVSLLVPLAIYSAPKAEAQANSGSSSDPAFSTTIPPIKNSVSIQPTGTITRRSDNEPVWVYDLNIISKDWIGGKSKPATVLKLKFTVRPNELTDVILSGDVSKFNENYRYRGRDITLSEISDLYSDITEIPVHASIGQLENAVTRPITPPVGGGTDWISRGESNPITLTINLRAMQSPGAGEERLEPEGILGFRQARISLATGDGYFKLELGCRDSRQHGLLSGRADNDEVRADGGYAFLS